MEKDYYTKEEVDKLMSQLREDILSNKQSNKTSRKRYTIKIDDINLLDYNNVGRYQTIEFLSFLKNLLEKSKLIKRTNSNTFFKAFRGEIINDDSGPLLEWIGQKNLCIYFLEELTAIFELNEKHLNLKAELIFGVTNSKELKRNYKKINKESLPSNYNIIEDIINKCREWSMDIGEKNSEDDIYFKKYIISDIENDLDN